jgi:hypothetical protein
LLLPSRALAAGAVEQPADDEGRVELALGQHAGDEAGRGRLAVGAGDRNAVMEAHQLGEHLGAAHHRDARRAGPSHLRVVRVDGGGDHHGIDVLDVPRVVADEDVHAALPQALGRRALARSEPCTS